MLLQKIHHSVIIFLLALILVHNYTERNREKGVEESGEEWGDIGIDTEDYLLFVGGINS